MLYAEMAAADHQQTDGSEEYRHEQQQSETHEAPKVSIRSETHARYDIDGMLGI
jgi:hypothetical protein